MLKKGKSALFFSVFCGLMLCTRPAFATAFAHADRVVLPMRERLGELLTNPVVATVLLIVGIAGIVIEVATVGSFGAFGILGVLAFTAYFLGSAWNGSLTVAALILLAAGVVLLIAEIFFVPGFGVPGALGILAILTALVVASPTPGAAVIELFLALVVAAGLIWFSLKNRKTREFWKRFMLSARLDHAAGFDSVDPALHRFQGATGVALTTLRPAGSASLNGEKVDVVTNGEFIPAGTPVRVSLVEGARVVVEAAPREE
ncbi:MAG: nodulation efficiency protein NfeD [Firmicutes bacterium]|nr:nodulation efficiency protein NfeD [Bacillota bacterium]